MALHNIITNEMIDAAVQAFSSKSMPGYTTLQIIDYLLKNEADAIDELKMWTPRNWRAIIGKAIKRYSVEMKKIKQVSTPDESPARWKPVF